MKPFVSELKLFLFGPPRLERAGQPVPLTRRRAKALLAYLALNPQSHSRDSLVALFWPDYDSSRGRADLSRLISGLNRLLGKDWLIAGRDVVGLNPEAPLEVDVSRFRQLLESGGRHTHPPDEVCPACLPLLDQAVNLYQEPFMTGFTLANSPDFDDWQRYETERLSQELNGALERLSQGYARQGDWELALRYTQYWAARAPLDEPAHRQLMTFYALSGQRTSALTQYETCRQILAEELAIAPEEQTTALAEQIRAGTLERMNGWSHAVEKPVALPALASLPVRHNLPYAATSFVGRQQELTDLLGLLARPDCRLVSLVGPGGMGKTRLALEAARTLVEQPSPAFNDGVFLIALADIPTMGQAIPALAEAVGFAFTGSEALRDQLATYLQSKQMLLILDNFEHLVEEAAGVSDLLQVGPDIKFLVTSRTRLNLYEEWQVQLHGLETPPPEVESTAAPAFSAVQLFVQRAKQVKPGFNLTGTEAAEAGRLCRLLEGVPLAIELAAAWVEQYDCGQIRDQIQRNFDFLTSSLRNIPERQRSLRAVFAYSWQLLPPPEQAALARLSVFHSGFTTEAAERVAGAAPPVMTSLVDKSLLQRRAPDRFGMHELLRQFAAEQLAEAPAYRAKHARFFAEQFRARETGLLNGDPDAVAMTGTDLDNLRAAWQWAVDQADVPTLDRLLGGLTTFFELRGWFREGRELLSRARQAIEAVGPAADFLGGRLEEGLARFFDHLGHYQQAKERAEKSLALFEAVNAPAQLARARAVWGFALSALGDNLTAETALKESLAIFEQLADPRGQAETLYYLSFIATGLGDRKQGLAYVERSLTLYQALGDRRHTAHLLFLRGNYQIGLGQYRQALAYYEESKALHREIGNRVGLAECLRNESLAAIYLDWPDQAEAWAQAALNLFSEFGDSDGVAGCFEKLGQVAANRQDYPQAKQYFEQARARFQAMGNTLRVARLESFLGHLAAKGGDLETARAHFRQALSVTAPAQALGYSLICLVEMTTFLRGRGWLSLAVQLLAHVVDHPASEAFYRRQAEQALATLATDLPPADFAAWQAQGQATPHETLVATLLELL